MSKIKKKLTCGDVIDEFFKDDPRFMYYNAVDYIQDGHYLRLDMGNGHIVLYVECSDGEVPIKVFKPEQGEEFRDAVVLLIR
jgi:hypothetical protein